jgi:hypothetical protein
MSGRAGAGEPEQTSVARVSAGCEAFGDPLFGPGPEPVVPRPPGHPRAASVGSRTDGEGCSVETDGRFEWRLCVDGSIARRRVGS